MKCFVILIVTSLIIAVLGQDVSVHFTQNDYGFLNETDDSFAVLSVQRVGRLGRPFTVFIELLEPSNDFKTDAWTISFPDDSTSSSIKSVTVSLADDDIPEKDETFSFRLRSSLPSVDVTEPAKAHLVILANDDANGIVGFNMASAVQTHELSGENATVSLLLLRNRGRFGDIAIRYVITSTQDSTTEIAQSAAQDLWPVEGVVTISDGEHEKSFDITILDDEKPENDEAFEVTLTDVTGGASLNQTAKSIRIVVKANDSPLRFSQRIYKVQEDVGSFGIRILRGMDEAGLSRVGPDTGQVWVDCQVTQGTATPSVDYLVNERSAIRFEDQQHEATLQIFVLEDKFPEMSENFTVHLLSNSVTGDAIVTEPAVCTVVIETNDKANGVLSIDLSEAENTADASDGKAFLIEEDKEDEYSGISVTRQGGSFSRVTVEWTLSVNGSTDVINDVIPTSGILEFAEGQTRAIINITVIQDELPSEAKLLIFRLLPDTVTGGAELAPPTQASVILSDSDDVYGVIDFHKPTTRIEVNNNERSLVVHLVRTGGLVGDVEVFYYVYYLSPEEENVRNAMPGKLRKSQGRVVFEHNEDNKEIEIEIEPDAFLEVGSRFIILLEKVLLLDRVPVISPHTPRLASNNFTLEIVEQFANGEIGFSDASQLDVDEPTDEEGPLVIPVGLVREGLSGEATVHVSYRSVGGNEVDVKEGSDYLRGHEIVKFPAGGRSKNITITILPDDLPELEEAIMIRLDSIEPNNQKLKRTFTEKRIAIKENDSPGGIFSFSNETALQYTLQEKEWESVTVTVERQRGDLALRFVKYDVLPEGAKQFYGVPEILVFKPGVRTTDVSLVPRDDSIPELDTNYTLVLLPYGEPPSDITEGSTVQVTLLANDNPSGLFVFSDDVNTPKLQSIGESKGDLNKTAHFRVSRTMGSFGEVSVSWRIVPDDTNDVTPNHGLLEFAAGETEHIISVTSVADEIPESMEEFTFYLYNSTDGAEIERSQNATLIIEPNDKAIYFEGMSEVNVNEGEDVVLTIHRDGSGVDSTTVKYHTGVRNASKLQHQATAGEEFQHVSNEEVTFQPGIRDVDVVIPVFDDDIAEDNEKFFVEFAVIIFFESCNAHLEVLERTHYRRAEKRPGVAKLYDATEDYVVYGNIAVNITVKQSDDANGIFAFVDHNPTTASEGEPVKFRIQRSRGDFGSVSLRWKIFRDEDQTYQDLIEDNNKEEDLMNEFEENGGVVLFEERDTFKDLVLEASRDSIPEYDERFILVLLNVTGGTAKLSSHTMSLMVRFVVKLNDNPFGLMVISNETSAVSIAEDGENDNRVNISIERTMGSDGLVKVSWELRPTISTLPLQCTDLILGGTLHGDAVYGEGRQNVNTLAVNMKSGYLELQRLDNKFDLSATTFSSWIRINYDETVNADNQNIAFVLYSEHKAATNNTLSSFKLTRNEHGLAQVVFNYRSHDEVERMQTVTLKMALDVFNNEWHHIAILLANDTINLYLDAVLQSSKFVNVTTIYDVSNDDVFMRAGPNNHLDDPLSCTMQDLRLYPTSLSINQIEELYHMQTELDLRPIAGYLEYGAQVTSANVTLYSVDDVETEKNEIFIFSLLDATGGAEIGRDNDSSVITVLKSDNSNGLFRFSRPCFPDRIEEGQQITCYVNRTRGLHGTVLVQWKANFKESESDDDDFSESEGILKFLPGEVEKSFNLTIVDDKIPEIDEVHDLVLINVTSLDGVRSSAAYSGASLDQQHLSADVVIQSNDKPNGVLQFSAEPPPSPSDNGRLLEENKVPVIHVREEDDHVILTVVRANGWFGHVTAEWRTSDGTAISRQEPKDFESSAGIVTLEDGVGYAQIKVALVDDDESELEKYFFVELTTPTGGASLNNASRIRVIIEPSDDAFGIFQFNQTATRVAEPTTGTNATKLRVVRRGGNLGEATVHWRLRNNSTRDAVPGHGLLQFVEGQFFDDITIEVLSDDVPEFDEEVKVDLTKVSQGSLGSHATTTITISANDDPRGLIIFSPNSVSVQEGENATLFLKRLGGSSGTIRVHYATMDTYSNNTILRGIALPDRDYKHLTSSILIRENITDVSIIIPIIDDDVSERDEVFFVQLLSVELVSSGVKVDNSPRLGTDRDILTEISIDENDSPHGVLELSSTYVTVSEDESHYDVISKNITDQLGPSEGFLSVVRRRGTFGDVSVSVSVTPGSARPQEDYNLIASEVTLLDGEFQKIIPLRIIDDFTPELEEDFTVELLRDSVTGGAEVGEDVNCSVVISQSDDPYGLLGISVELERVEEPPHDRVPITFTVHRKAGHRGVVGLKWVASIEPAPSAAEGGLGNPGSNPADNGKDIDVREGHLHFTTNVLTQQFTIKVLPDDVPEDDEIVRVRLENILPNSKGRIDPKHNEAHVIIPANDRPYGDVSVDATTYFTDEDEERDSILTVKIVRSGGRYGTMRVVYSTFEVDLVTEIIENDDDNLLEYFSKPRNVEKLETNIIFHFVDINSAENPLMTCGEACLRQRNCHGFLYNEMSYKCKWVTQEELDRQHIKLTDHEVQTPTGQFGRFKFYGKNTTKTNLLYGSQAKSGVDFLPLSGASVLLMPGQDAAYVNIIILSDTKPELDEHFKVSLLSVEMLGFEPGLGNRPIILNPSTSRITIRKNDHPYGIFRLINQETTLQGSPVGPIEVEERPQLSLEMVVERQGGSVGNVTVDWSVTGGTALRNDDFTGDDATLKFSDKETAKVISLTVLDDGIPEANEDIAIRLSNPTGGAVIDSQQDKTRIIILANDVAGGSIGFREDSRSLIGKEGGNVTLHLLRSLPALGRCSVTWYGEGINGHNVYEGLNETQGTILFEPLQIEATLLLHIISDETPETQEEYRIVLSQAESLDIPSSGGAILDIQSTSAQISIDDSDDPHGIFRFDPKSQRIDLEEDSGNLEIFVTRQFGAIGNVRVYYDVIPGTLSTLNPDIGIAQAGIDFVYNQTRPYVTFNDGVTSASITMDVIDDDIPELNEIFHVNLSHAEVVDANGVKIQTTLSPKIDAAESLSQIVIDANDGTKGVVRFDPEYQNIAVTETQDTKVNLRLIRDRGTYGEVTVFIFPQNKEAVLDKDYFCEPKTLVFADSQDEIDYEVIIVDDDIPEGNESFEVLIDNPSAGLSLGNITKATITITSNDDAHGRLAFDNEPVIYLEEPESSNFTESRAELIVSRSPRDGVFGRISVRFKVEQILSNGNALSSVNDITPAEGYVTIEDGVSSEVIELAVNPDNDTELQERFMISLFDPQYGATLNQSGITTEIFIRENDAPYGKFQVFPSGSRSLSRQLKLKERSALLNVDIVRSQGTLGSVTVDVQTMQDTAISLPDSISYPPSLAPFQIFPGSSGVWFHSFEHRGTYYLIYLTSALIGPLTTAAGSSGSLASLTAGVHSTLYKWQGVYVPVQTFETDGATCATSFLADSRLYIFITNGGTAGRRETWSRLYVMEEDTDLRVVQDVETKGATSVVHFYKNHHYLVVANGMDNNQVSSIDSAVLRMSESTSPLEEIQTLPTRGAAGLETFTLKDHFYLAVANSIDSESDVGSAVSSIIYRWDSLSSSFTQRTNVDVSYATDVQHYVVDQDHCLLIFSSATSRVVETANQRNTNVVKIFQVLQNNRAGNILLRPHQSLNVTGASKIQLLTSTVESLGGNGMIQTSSLRNGNVTLLMISSQLSSQVLLFNFETSLFELLFNTKPAVVMHPHVVSSSLRSTTLVAIATNHLTARSRIADVSLNLLSRQPFQSGVYDIINKHNYNATSEFERPSGDFIALSKSLIFEPGQEVITVTMTLLDDDIPEKDEKFKITLSNSHDHRAIIDDVTSTLEVVIESNDDAHGVIGFEENSIEKVVEETPEDDVFTLNVVRHVSTYGTVMVDWMADGSINDISPVSGQITFEEGQSIVGIQLTVLADDIPEVEEIVTIQLTNPRLVGQTSTSSPPRLNDTSALSRIQILANDSPHGVVRWAPNSLRTVVNEVVTLSGASQLVTLEMIREQGMLGDIEVHFHTSPAGNLPLHSQATPGADYVTRDSSLVMRENTTRAAVAVSIIPDDIPEDIESFYVIIDDVTLIGESTVGGEPGIGRAGTYLAEVTIDENDDARGFIQFDVKRNSEGVVDAFELPRTNNSLKLPLQRLIGFVRTVGVEWLARPGTARNADFFPSSGSVQFLDGTNSSEIEIFIMDDHDVEFMESFTVQLVSTSGGAKLGGDLVVTVNIFPNDSPSGMFGFMKKEYRLKESSSANDPEGVVQIQVNRFQGSDEDVTLQWKLDESARADLSPMSGKLMFAAKTRSQSIVLRSLPDQQLEGEERFKVILISATGGAEISPVADQAHVVIAANKGAAGVVSVLTKEVYTSEPEKNGYDGVTHIELQRGPGMFGKVLVDWQITPADKSTFEHVQGKAIFEKLHNLTTIKLHTINDDIPETSKDYVLRLVTSSGGATLHGSADSCLVHVVASDNPHGSFTLAQPLYHVKEGIEFDDVWMNPSLVTSSAASSSYVSVSVLRNDGHLGEVAVTVRTFPGSAMPNVDYYPINERLIFTDGDAFQRFDVEIIDDKIPEGPQEFFVNITDIQLLSHLKNDYVTHDPFNLTLDSPPIYGDNAWSVVRIDKSDGAEGIVQFATDAVDITVEEDDGEVRVPLVRSGGSYGSISVTINAVNQTAKRNVDFLMPYAGLSVAFEDGQTRAFVSVDIIDDDAMENEEKFTLALTSVAGGARLGERKFAEVIIKKSDYPNGVIRFIGDNDVTIENPPISRRGNTLNFRFERYGGNQLPIVVRWRIERTSPFILPTTSASPLVDDISSTLSGRFEFADGEGGQRQIRVNILPSVSAQEVEERFVILIEESEPAEVSKEKGNVTITVQKKGHPNGVIKFGTSIDKSDTPAPRKFADEPSSGKSQLVFPITRISGSIGPVNVTWSISPVNQAVGASENDVEKFVGSILMQNAQIDADIIVTILSDDQPELEETFLLTLVSVNGGADIDEESDRQVFVIRANDDPHGVFAVRSEDQSIIIDSQMKRLIRVNITRDRGVFGRVVVGFEVRFDDSIKGTSYIATNSGTALFATDTTWTTEDVPISPSASLLVGESFTVQLSSVEYLDSDKTIEPRISQQFSSAIVKVVSEVGNSQVGFESIIAHVKDVKSRICELRVIRIGSYGDVSIQWSSGYLSQQEPAGITEGKVSPPSGVIMMSRLQTSVNLSVTLLPSHVRNNAFAVHLTRVDSAVSGGAKMLRSQDAAEIDPCGAVRFAPSHQKVIFTGVEQQVNLTVQRLFGSRYDIIVHYSALPSASSSGVAIVSAANGEITMVKGEKEKNISIILSDSLSGESQSFIVNLTSAIQPQNIYRGASPRIIPDERVSHVTLAESANVRGMLLFSEVHVRTKEDSDDGSEVLILMLEVHRTVGAIGDVSVMASTIGGGEEWDEVLTSSSGNNVAWTIPSSMKQRINNDGERRATAGSDYEVRQINVTFKEGTSVVSIPVVIIDDVVAEPEESFYLILHSTTGGAEVSPESGLVKITIKANDVPNGVVGFQRKEFVIDEDSSSRSTDLRLTRTHAYGDVEISWRALSSYPMSDVTDGDIFSTPRPTDTSQLTWKSRGGLHEKLETTHGIVTCPENQLDCDISITLKDDEIAEFAETFFVELYDISDGGEIESNARIANVTIEESDSPHGLFQFSISSRLPVVTKGGKSVGLTIERIGGDSTSVTLRYHTRQLQRTIAVAGATLYPAVVGIDYIKTEEAVTFNPGEREAFISVALKPDSNSANPLPQLFQVVLSWASGGSKISDTYNVANVTIVRDGSVKRVWGVYETLQQELDDAVISGVISQLHDLADGNLEQEEIQIFHGCLNDVLAEGRRRRLTDQILADTYQLFCKLLDPNRQDAVRGYADFSKSFDELALCLTSQAACVTDDVTTISMKSCKHVIVQSSRWYPQQINGFKFTGRGDDYFEVPPDLLNVAGTETASSNLRCYDIYFIEYSSAIWFEVEGDKEPMSKKIFSVGVDEMILTSLKTPVRYRVYTNDARISPQGAECVLWNEASSRWLTSAGRTCRVVDDSSNFVQCECYHMSVYAARGPTDNLAGYNGATYTACFMVMVGAFLALLSHHLCARRSKFASRLLMHMFFACAITQLIFVIGGLTSRDASEDVCSAIGIFFHYFWLAQFTWMLSQAINALQVLGFSNENTDRFFVIHLIGGWGIPGMTIILYVIVMFAFGSNYLKESYGDVHGNGDMCMIVNSYGVVLSAVIPACMCILIMATVAFHLYQKKATWKNYDDVFAGRLNSTEIPLLFWFFFLVSITWLWGGLHLTYGYMWMLVLFIICNFMQGIYVLVVYSILHNPLCNRPKDLYDEGLDKNNDIVQEGYETSVVNDGLPSISEEIGMNKSTQSLMKFEGEWDELDGSIIVEGIASPCEISLKEDSADFDDLLFVLQNESKLDEDQSEETEIKQIGGPVDMRQSLDFSPLTLESDDEENLVMTPSVLPIGDTHL